MASAGAAGADPAAIAANIAVWKQRDRRHDVSIQAGALAGAAYRGMAPRAKTSMTIMRPPRSTRSGIDQRASQFPPLSS